MTNVKQKDGTYVEGDGENICARTITFSFFGCPSMASEGSERHALNDELRTSESCSIKDENR